VLRIDPYEFLYPFLQSWPSPSRSAETVVVRREGDSVLFLNELRHRRGVELAFRLPLNRPGLPSALAVTGEPRIIEGVDYRGVPVLAAVRPLPDSPWFLVTKVDIEEIYAPIRERAWLTTLVASLLILTAGAVLGFWWKHRASAFYRQQLESQRERETLARQEAEVRSRLAAIVESSGDAIIGIAPDRRVTSWNPGAERLYGYQAEEVIGRPISFLVPEERRGEVYEVMNRVLLGEWAAGYETVRLRKDGSPVQVSVTVSPVKDNSGAIVGISTIARDITEQKRSEAERARLLELEKAARLEAEAASRMKDEFLATVSHELRTPLEPILGWAYSLLHDDLDAETTAEALESIERNARVQASLVEDLLDVSRFDAGKLRLDMTTLDVAAPVRAALDGVRTTAKAREIRLELVVENGPRRVRGDVNRLQQVMWNLLSNALKFTHDGGRIDVRVRSDGDCVEISVADTGQGIEPEFLPRVFDRFTQADSSPTRKQRGLGLGLTIVRQLVELHGGEVRAESRGAGQGATFTVRLPSLADVHAAELQ
jgi:PAS domain S-box-containing protein